MRNEMLLSPDLGAGCADFVTDSITKSLYDEGDTRCESLDVDGRELSYSDTASPARLIDPILPGKGVKCGRVFNGA